MKYFVRTLCVLLLSFLIGCDFLYKKLDKEGGEEKDLIGEVIPFEVNPTVEEIQALLFLYGYNPGRIDGKMGVNTRRAVERFQNDLGLTVSGRVDQETWGKLKLFSDIGLVADTKLNVTLIQEILKEHGFNPGKIDGKFGPRTKTAVKAFQTAHTLKADGKVGYRTLTALAQYLE